MQLAVGGHKHGDQVGDGACGDDVATNASDIADLHSGKVLHVLHQGHKVAGLRVTQHHFLFLIEIRAIWKD